MTFSAEFVGLVLLLTSAAALGISMVVDIGKFSAERARLTMSQRAIEKKRAALTDWQVKSERKSVDLKEQQARLNELLTKRQKALAEVKSVQFSKVELIHELGESDGAMAFWTLLTTVQDLAKVERHEVLFSRQIWDYRNVAHVWAGSTEQASSLIKLSFTPRSGVQPTQMLPLAFAPDGTPQQQKQGA